MAARSPLMTLIELAQRRADDAVQALGEAVRFAEAAREKLALLAQYRDDYASRFQAGLVRGLSMLDYQNYCSFLDQLESAAGRQERAVRDAEEHVEARRAAWREAVRRRDSFVALADRMEAEQRKIASKYEQRLTDEHAIRSRHARRYSFKRKIAS